MLDSPHSGTQYPADFGCIAPTHVIRKAEDAFVDELFAAAPQCGASLLRALFPRTYIDPNRSLDDIDQALLDEAWRALGPGGRMMVMVPNRAGLWAASDGTPFGLGRSYTAGQIESQTRKSGFVAHWHGSAVYIPPSDRRFWLGSAQMWERTGARISRVLIAGVVLIELAKQTRAPVGPGRAIQVPGPREILDGVGLPRPGRAGTARRGGVQRAGIARRR